MNKNKNNKKSDVSWIKPSEPSFLKKFKSDVGYKEGPTVDTKRQMMPTFDDDDSGSDREDELPQVVVLKKGDLSADEVKKMKGDGKEKDDEAPADGKILFKKPAKRSSSDKFQGITASSSKKKRGTEKPEKSEEPSEEDEEGKKEEKSGEGKKEEKSGEGKKEEKSGKKVKNSLLSFGDDEEED